MSFFTSFTGAGLCVLLVLPIIIQAKTCFMQYMIADNEGEFYMRQKYLQLSTSSAVKNEEEMRTWIYYDAGTVFDSMNSQGEPIPQPFTGSRIMAYNASLGTLQVVLEFPTEQNSDLPTTLQTFMEHALGDCLVDGFDSLFLGLAGYGGDFWGFGGDQSKRHLLQTNQDVASGIRAALDSVGSVDRIDVIAFDASLMQDIGVGADYMSVTRHILASQSVVPGYGWPYANLTSQADAVAFATHILDAYLAPDLLDSPRTMSLIEIDKYITFLEIWDSTAEAMLNILQSGDPSLYAYFSRARQASVFFDGGADGWDNCLPSSLDIGSFLQLLMMLCNPIGSNLIVFLDINIDVYDEMFVHRGHGNGSTAGTGMHVTWPSLAEYAANADLWNDILFDHPSSVTRHSPKFKMLLQWWLSSSPPGGAHEDSVCNERAVAVNETNSNKLILMEEGGQVNSASGVMDRLRADIASSVSHVEVQFGMDLTGAFESLVYKAGYERSQQDQKFYLLGGDIPGQYSKSSYRASWDQNFFFFNTSGELDPVYVSDRKDGAKQINVLFFPEYLRNATKSLVLEDFILFDLGHWIQLGAQPGFVTFSVDHLGRLNNNLGLFTGNVRGAFAEQPLEEGGLIIPLTYVDAHWQGRNLEFIPGGLNQKFYNWSAEIDSQLVRLPAKDVLAAMPSLETIVVNLYAYNVVNKSVYSDKRYFDALKPEAEGRFSAVDAATTFLAFTHNNTKIPEAVNDTHTPTAPSAPISSGPPTPASPPFEVIINIPEFIENSIDPSDDPRDEDDSANVQDGFGTISLPEFIENIIDADEDSGDDGGAADNGDEGDSALIEPSSNSPTAGPTLESMFELALFADANQSSNASNLYLAVGPMMESESTRRHKSWALVTTVFCGWLIYSGV